MHDSQPRSDPGTYALLLRAYDPHVVAVGALGRMRVRPGWYVYVGSAFGPGGVRARVQRHARDEGALHWHIDYVRTVTSLERVWWTHDTARRECTWAEVLREPSGTSVPLDGFGASDCDCPAHLYFCPEAPSLEVFRARIRVQCPGHAVVKQVAARRLA